MIPWVLLAWNVGGLPAGRLALVLETAAAADTDFLILTSTLWAGSGRFTYRRRGRTGRPQPHMGASPDLERDGYLVIYHGAPRSYRGYAGGVMLCIRLRWVKYVCEIRTSSERLLSARVRGSLDHQHFDVAFIAFYSYLNTGSGPSGGACYEKKRREAWEGLGAECVRLPARTLRVLGLDGNDEGKHGVLGFGLRHPFAPIERLGEPVEIDTDEGE